MAERRQRTQQSEKRLISRRTQKLLANLYDQTRVLRHEPRLPHRSFYSDPIPGLDWGEEDEMLRTTLLDGEDDEDPLDADVLMEGAGSRRAAELYDSYYNRPLRRHAPFFARPSGTSPSDSLAPSSGSLAEDVWGLERIFRGSGGGPLSTAGASASASATATAGGNAPSGAGVTRTGSIRRAARNRAVDFSDFAARRRQSTRLGIALDAEAATQRSDDSSAPIAGGSGSGSANGGASLPPHRVWDAPWNSATNSLAGTSSRTLSGTNRLRRAIGGLPPEAFLLRSVTSPPPFYSRESMSTPPIEPSEQWVHFSQSGAASQPEASSSTARARAQSVGESQMLTPRSSTPDDVVTASTAPAQVPTPAPTSQASVAGSQAPGSP